MMASIDTAASRTVGNDVAQCTFAVMEDRLAYFARLVDEAPDVARARFGYANELLHAERFDEAVVQLRAYLDLAEDEGNAWGKLAEALTRLGRVDEAADAYLAGIDQSLKHGHTGMADDFQAALEAL
jgi:Flp pilus assembly protein TadD